MYDLQPLDHTSATAGNGTGRQRAISAKGVDGEHFLSLSDLLQVLRRWIWLLLSVTIMIVGAVGLFSWLQTPMYEASIEILVGQEKGSGTPGDLGGAVQGLQQLTKTMVEGVDSDPIAEAVIQEQSLQVTPENFLKNLDVRQVGDTQFIQVSYRDPSPERARQVANTVGDVFSKRVSEVSPSANSITATVWKQAQVPNKPASPNIMRNLALALILGLIVGGGLAYLLEYLNDTWSGPEEVEQISRAPNLGSIPRI